MFQLLSVILLLFSFLCFSKERIIYGDDNRQETFEVKRDYQELAKSSAGMISNLKLVDIGDHFVLPPTTLGKTYGLCEGERFKDQPNAVTCSGFLVGDDLLVTAGHCIRTQKDCESLSWVFDFKLEEKTKRAKVAIDKNNVFKCKKVIDSKLEGKGENLRDFALIQLDRKTKRKPLRFRTSGKIASGTNLVLIGHPSGLPQKVAPSGRVFDNKSKRFFKTNVDSFGGNSGSPVFNKNTNKVEGILVRGAKDYLKDECGIRVNTVEEDIKGKARLGESVSRITDLEALKNRRKFLVLLKGRKNIAEIIKFVDKYPYVLSFIDKYGNNPLHLALRLKNDKAFDKFIQIGGANINGQNDRGETPLHIAAAKGRTLAVKSLLEKGAFTFITDNMGKLPSQRVLRHDIGIKKLLTVQENKDKKASL